MVYHDISFYLLHSGKIRLPLKRLKKKTCQYFTKTRKCFKSFLHYVKTIMCSMALHKLHNGRRTYHKLRC